MTDLDVLEKLQVVFGVGNIISTKKIEEHHKQAWVWTVSRVEDAVYVMKTVYPYMMSRRQSQIEAALVIYESTIVADRKELLKRDARIHELRLQGLLTKDIANEVGVSRQAVSRVLNNRNKYNAHVPQLAEGSD